MRSVWVLGALALGLGMGSQPAKAAELVRFEAQAPAGTVVVHTPSRRLYFVNGDGTAMRYQVAVGRPGKQWSGSASIAGKYLRPAWTPPDEVKRDNPNLPDLIPGGSPRNPMGEAAMVLNRGQYAIHGTNVPGSIGHAASYGCIRMHNNDVLDLYSRVSVGTPVVVVQ